jgi:hypothetical protein
VTPTICPGCLRPTEPRPLMQRRMPFNQARWCANRVGRVRCGFDLMAAGLIPGVYPLPWVRLGPEWFPRSWNGANRPPAVAPEIDRCEERIDGDDYTTGGGGDGRRQFPQGA